MNSSGGWLARKTLSSRISIHGIGSTALIGVYRRIQSFPDRITRAAECPLHLPPDLHRIRIRVVLHILPAHRLALGDVALEPDLVRKPDGQGAFRGGVGGGHEATPDGIAALAVERLACLQCAL